MAITRVGLVLIALQPFCAVLPIWGTAPHGTGFSSRETFKLPLLWPPFGSSIIVSLLLGERRRHL